MADYTDLMSALQYGLKAIDQERASIIIVGRAFTPEEEARLDVLEKTHQHILAAIETLNYPIETLEDTPVVVPDDGRYTLANDVLALQLRIDIDGMHIISGDVFAVSQGHQEYLASFISQPGLDVSKETHPVPIVGEDRDGTRAEGKIEFIRGEGRDLTIALTFDAQLRGLPINQSINLVGRKDGQQMRQLGLEVEVEDGLDIEASWKIDGEEFTVESALEDAGLEVINVGRRDSVPTPASGSWHIGHLHDLMNDLAQEPLDRPDWNLHLMFLSQARESGLLGIMFDSRNRDLNQLPRQGVAVFVDPIQTRPDWERKLIQTTVHELGHALNLAHRFERPVGRADSISFMNYDWKYLGGHNAHTFWRNFRFTFDQDELLFMRHGPWQKVVPGGAEFHTVPYWENTSGEYVPYIPEVPSSDFRIELEAPNRGLFQFAQPVFLTVRLHNRTGRPMNIPKELLDPKAGLVEFVVRRITRGSGLPEQDQGQIFRPLAQRCFDMDHIAGDRVPNGGTIQDNVNLTFGSAGFTFAEPGDYEVTAYFVWQKARNDIRTVKSSPIRIRVGFPKTEEEERDAMDFFRSDVGNYLVNGGSYTLSDAEDTLLEIAERRQGSKKAVVDPLVANIRRCQGLKALRGAIRLQDGEFAEEAPDLKDAYLHLASIDEIADAVFDPISAGSLHSLVNALGKEIKK